MIGKITTEQEAQEVVKIACFIVDIIGNNGEHPLADIFWMDICDMLKEWEAGK